MKRSSCLTAQSNSLKKNGRGDEGEGDWVKNPISSQSCSGNGGPILGTPSRELSKLPPDRIPLPNSQHGSWNLELIMKVPDFIPRSNNCIVRNDTLRATSKEKEANWGSAKHVHSQDLCDALEAEATQRFCSRSCKSAGPRTNSTNSWPVGKFTGTHVRLC